VTQAIFFTNFPKTQDEARTKLLEKQIRELVRSSRELGFNNAKVISLIKKNMKDSLNE